MDGLFYLLLKWAYAHFFFAQRITLLHHTDFEEKLVALIEPAIKALGCELVQVRYVPGKANGILRILLDKPGGVSLDDCEEASHTVSDILDVADPIPGHYSLEMSSPGINRPLTKQEDFERFAGQKVYLETKTPLDGRKRLRGILKGCVQDKVVVETEKNEIDIPIELLVKARLDIL